MNNNKKPMIIAQIMGKWLGGGVESVVMNYYRHIDRNKIQFDFICDSDSTDIPYEEIEKLGGRVIMVPPYQKIFKYKKELKKIFKENQYKIVHSHINTLSVFPLQVAKKSGIPVRIIHSHSTTNKKEWKKNLIKQIIRPFSKVYATDYFACSEHAGRWLFGNKEFEKGNIVILNNAIDVEKFQYNEEIRKQKRKELGIDNNTLVIGHVGRFVTTKNHDFLIEIFNEIHKNNSNSILMLIGKGNLIEKIKIKVNKLGLTKYVMFLGQRDDVNKLYQTMDLLLLPSLYEGLGLVLVEAQCSGTTCVASTNVPISAKMCENLCYINLKENAKVWSNTIMSFYNRTNRKDISKELNKHGYDINIESKKLVDLYLSRVHQK